MSLTIVVAKYKEDISWIDTLNGDYNIKIYDKEHDYPNVGREAETYLRFILENYDNMPEYVAFVQGNPFDHFDKDKLFNHLKNYTSCENMTFLTNHLIETMDFSKKNWNMAMYESTKALFHTELPSEITFSQGAQFIVCRKNIIQRPKWFYQKIYNVLFRENPLCFGINHSKCLVCPWTLERLWFYIFTPSIQHREFEETDLFLK